LISRSVVDQHGGRLLGASDGKNLGATFTVEIPSVDTPAVAERADEPHHPGAINGHAVATTVLVENNVDFRNSLSRLLTLRGHEVHVAPSMERAVKIASELPFELLISDIDLPDGSGLELMWKLRRSRTFSGIALSGFGSSEDIELSRSAGFAEHLTKPVDFRRLETAIDRATVREQVERMASS
jgi:DNA-binding NtrC family response regulator